MDYGRLSEPIVIRRAKDGDAAALADKIVWAMDHPDERARLSAAARVTGRRYDISAFVGKMERLYTLMHEVSRPTHRKGVAKADLAFLS